METKIFTLFWLTGKSELVEGKDVAQAMTLAGYSQGAVGALDFYANGDNKSEYYWNKAQQSWKLNT